MEVETQEHETRKCRSIWYKKNKEIDVKSFGLGFLGMSMHAHT